MINALVGIVFDLINIDLHLIPFVLCAIRLVSEKLLILKQTKTDCYFLS